MLQAAGSKALAIQPGKRAMERTARHMQEDAIVMVILTTKLVTELAGRVDGGHSKTGPTVKEEQHLSARNVAVTRGWQR